MKINFHFKCWIVLIFLLIGVCVSSNFHQRDIETGNLIVRRMNVDLVDSGRVPQEQVDAAKAINLCLFWISYFWNYNGILPNLSIAFFVITGFFSFQTYTGYNLRLVSGSTTNDSLFARVPRFQVSKIDFGRVKDFAHFEQWFFSPLSWIIQVLLMLPDNQYQSVKAQFFLPDAKILSVFYLIIVLNMLGFFHK